MADSVRFLMAFLREENVPFSLRENVPLSLTPDVTPNVLHDFIELNFNRLDESVLRLLIARAMRDRDSNISKGVNDGQVQC